MGDSAPKCPVSLDVMSPFEQDLATRLAHIREQALFRELRPIDSPQKPQIQSRGRYVFNFSSNDYLGLANDPELKEAATRAIQDFGAGSGASRLISGSLAPHQELEETLANFKGVPAALSFSSGFAAALGAIGAVVEKGDVVVLDRLAHACLVDAARLSGAELRVFRHNDPESLDNILRQETAKTGSGAARRRVLVVTESVFSMDGDRAPLKELVEVKDRYGAWLMVDEAHGTGLYGPHLRGVADELGVRSQIEIQMGTMGKALGSAGGFICGPRLLIDLLINRARSFIFTTAPVPAAAAAASTALKKLMAGRCAAHLERLWANVAVVRETLGSTTAHPCPILPLHVGNEAQAVQAARALLDKGFLVPAVRYPTVGRGKARLRLTVTAAHEPGSVAQLLAALQELGFRKG